MRNQTTNKLGMSSLYSTRGFQDQVFSRIQKGPLLAPQFEAIIKNDAQGLILGLKNKRINSIDFILFQWTIPVSNSVTDLFAS